MVDTPLLLVGLGNPGGEYARNRHNAGFLLVDRLHDAYGFGPWRAKFQGLIADGKIAGRKTYLLKPQTFMNRSGDSVGPAARFLKLPIDAVVVFHDDIDLAAGKLKAKTGGGDAGHNGLRSITATLGADYRRVRIGVGHPDGKVRVVGHVLGNFSKTDDDWLPAMFDAIAEHAPLIAKDDTAGFLNKIALTLTPPANKG